MLLDDETIIFLGLSGALVPGGMRRIIVDLIRNNFIDVIVSTGANLFHDFFEASGFHHYIGSASAIDSELREAEVDRIYDTFASDEEFGRVEKRIQEIASQLERRIYSSREFLDYLAIEIDDDSSILGEAKKYGVPIFCPALCDSAIGIGLTHLYAESKTGPKLIIDQIRDNFEILQIKREASNTGVFYLGGGVPKNYIQQLTPMLDVFEIEGEGHRYYLQITTDDPKYGGLSGCTSSEAEAWGRVTSDGYSATVYIDASIRVPLIAGALIQNKEKLMRKTRTFNC